MVRYGKFTLELIDALTSRPFTEHHGKDGKTYAEVEPEIEYFLRISSDDPRPVCCRFFVDDKSLGYVRPLRQHQVSTDGIWCRENGVSKTTALKFNKLVNKKQNNSNKNDHDNDHNNDNIHWTGCVEMKIYELVSKECTTYNDVSSSWSDNTEHVLKGLNLSSNKKAINSTMGTTTIEKKVTGRLVKISPGAPIASIKLYYCSTVGLIAAKVLDPPPRQQEEGDDDDDDDDDDYEIEEIHPRKCHPPYQGPIIKIDDDNDDDDDDFEIEEIQPRKRHPHHQGPIVKIEVDDDGDDHDTIHKRTRTIV